MERDLFSALIEAVWQQTRAPEYAARYAELDLAHLRGQRSALPAIGDLFTREENERSEQAARIGKIFSTLPTTAESASTLVEPAMLLAGITPMSEDESSYFCERFNRATAEIARVHAERRRHREIA